MIVSPCSVTAASLVRKLMLLFLQGACAENWTDIFSGASDPEITLPQNFLVNKMVPAFSSVSARCIPGSSQ